MHYAARLRAVALGGRVVYLHSAITIRGERRSGATIHGLDEL